MDYQTYRHIYGLLRQLTIEELAQIKGAIANGALVADARTKSSAAADVLDWAIANQALDAMCFHTLRIASRLHDIAYVRSALQEVGIK